MASDLLIFLYQWADAMALLLLASIGLIVIFGMMGVINMAHGELMMIGAFSTAYSYSYGIPTPLAIILGGVAAACVGLVLERLIIRRFYGQLLASLVATWGISLCLSQGALLLFGPSIQGPPMTLPSFSIGEISFSSYRILLFAIGLASALGLWSVLQFTRFGIKARATMLDRDMARALGTNTVIVYSVTFGLGAFLAGFAGGLFALTAPIEPTFGKNFTAIAFIVVVVAGTRNIVLGTIVTVMLLGLLKTLFTSEFNILIGQVAMLLAAFLIIRLAPDGIIALLSPVGKALRLRPRKRPAP